VRPLVVYRVQVLNSEFIPSTLRIERGSVVEWRVCADAKESNELSLYHNNNRAHVLAFKTLATESPLLRESETYTVRFLEPGIFEYGC